MPISNDSKATKELYVHKTRIHPNNKQAAFFRGCCGFRRVAYNFALAAISDAWDHGVRLSPYQADKVFNLLKPEQFPWAYEYPSCVGQQAIIKDLSVAYKKFFDGLKKGDGTGYPEFKSRHSKKSFKLTNGVIRSSSFCGNRLELPKKQGSVKMGSLPKHRGRILGASISEKGGRWYAAFLYEVAPLNLPLAQGAPIGIDMGIAKLASMSDGQSFDQPKELARLRDRKKHIQRKLSKLQAPEFRKGVKGSNRWRKMKERIAALDRRIADIRSDCSHQITASISKSNSVVVIEDLNIKGMVKSAKGNAEKHGKNVKAKSGLNRELQSMAAGEFRRQLAYKTARHKGMLVAVNPAYTSQICSNCGHKDKDNRKSQASFKCVACGHAMNADHNAAINILNRGLEELAGKPASRARSTSVNGGGDVGQLGRSKKPSASAA